MGASDLDDVVARSLRGSFAELAYLERTGAAPTRDDARHLIWLRDEIGERFVGGVVLHTGSQ